jgi:hypothetical protein
MPARIGPRLTTVVGACNSFAQNQPVVPGAVVQTVAAHGGLAAKADLLAGGDWPAGILPIELGQHAKTLRQQCLPSDVRHSEDIGRAGHPALRKSRKGAGVVQPIDGENGSLVSTAHAARRAITMALRGGKISEHLRRADERPRNGLSIRGAAGSRP